MTCRTRVDVPGSSPTDLRVDEEEDAQAEDAQADHAHAHDRAAGEGDDQGLVQAVARRVGGAHVGRGGHPHAEEAGQARSRRRPPRSETPISQWLLATFVAEGQQTATTTTKMASTLYSRLRKAMAPSRMWPAIVCIFSLPASCRLTHWALKRAKTRASTPAAGMR